VTSLDPRPSAAVKARQRPARRCHSPPARVPTHKVPSGSASKTSAISWASAGSPSSCQARPFQRAGPWCVAAHKVPSAATARAWVQGSGRPSLAGTAVKGSGPGAKRATPSRPAAHSVPSAVSAKASANRPGARSVACKVSTAPACKREIPRPNEAIHNAPSAASCRARRLLSTMPGRRWRSSTVMRPPSKRTTPSEVPIHSWPAGAGSSARTPEVCARLGQAACAY
jgi:hypothetical protein